jgi:hypothetical protein
LPDTRNDGTLPSMATDLEADVLVLLEQTDGFAGAWRLSAKVSAKDDPFEIAVAFATHTSLVRAAGRLSGLAPCPRVLLFDADLGHPLVARASVITLTATERELARVRQELRERRRAEIIAAMSEQASRPHSNAFAVVNAERPRPRLNGAFTLLVSADRSRTARLRFCKYLEVECTSSLTKASELIDAKNPALVLLDLAIEGAVELGRRLAQGSLSKRVIYFGDHDARAAHPSIVAMRVPFDASSIGSLLAVAYAPAQVDGPKLSTYLGEPRWAGGLCNELANRCRLDTTFTTPPSTRTTKVMHSMALLIVDDEGSLTRQVRASFPWNVRIERVTNGWEAIERMEKSAFDWVLVNEPRTSEDEEPRSDVTGARLYQTIVALRPELMNHVLFGISMFGLERMRQKRATVVDNFFVVPIDPDALRARLSTT